MPRWKSRVRVPSIALLFIQRNPIKCEMWGSAVFCTWHEHVLALSLYPFQCLNGFQNQYHHDKTNRSRPGKHPVLAILLPYRGLSAIPDTPAPIPGHMGHSWPSRRQLPLNKGFHTRQTGTCSSSPPLSASTTRHFPRSMFHNRFPADVRNAFSNTLRKPGR